jgi:hypothetical protein
MAVTQILAIDKSFSSAVIPVTPFPSYVNHHAVTTAETETVPAGATRVVISTSADIWLSDGTGAVPAGDVIDGTGSFLMGAGTTRVFYVSPTQTLSVVSASGTANVSFEYFTA